MSLIINGSNNIVKIHPKCHLDFCKIEIWAKNSKLHINQGGIFLSTTFILAESDGDIEVGNECLFADGVELRTGDGHAIYDISNGNRINPPRSIRINDHVWLGREVKIQMGVQIARNSVIGMGSIVTKDLVYENSIYAGIPAVLKKKGIVWKY